jgi:hypothetical protein
MNYQKTYSSLIAKAQARTALIGYKERHHILPRSMGGTDDASNLVNLTAREHFIAHYLLAKIHGGSQWYSVIVMKGNSKDVNSRLYEFARIQHSKATSARQTGMKYSEAHRKAVSASMTPEVRAKIGAANSIALKGKKLPAETLAKLSTAHKGKKYKTMSEQGRENIGAAKKGKKLSNEHKTNIGSALKGKKYKPMSNQGRENIRIAQKLFNIKKRFLVVSTQYLTSAEWC